MSVSEFVNLKKDPSTASWRITLAERLESVPIQIMVTSVIVLNAIILGLDTSEGVRQSLGPILDWADKLCLVFFVIELAAKLVAYRSHFWRSGWNIFDAVVVGIALTPGA